MIANIRPAVVSLCLTAALLGTSACAGGSSGQNLTDGNGNEPVKLTLWGGVPAEAGPQEAIDNWNEQNPDVQVEYVRFVNDDVGNIKLDTALMTGQGVDLYVTYNYPRFETRVKSNLALDLGQFTDYDIDEMMGPEAEDWKVDGNYFAMPTKKDLHFVWFNMEALQEAGLEVPYDWTWEDMREYAKRLAEVRPWGMVQDLITWDFVLDSPIDQLVADDGTSNLDNPFTRQILETMHGMMYEDGSRAMYGEQLATKMRVEDEFLRGEAGMFYAGEWIFRFANNLNDYPRDFQIALAPIPKVSEEQTNHKVFGGLGDAVSINPKSPHIEEAWEFLKWYADGGMAPLTHGGRIPSSKAISIEESMELLLEGVEHLYDVDSVEKVLFSGDFPTFQTKLEQQIIDARRKEYQLYFTNDQSLDQMFEKLVNEHEQFLERRGS